MNKKILIGFVMLLTGIIMVSQEQVIRNDTIVAKNKEVETRSVFKLVSTELPTLNVKHETKGNQVFVETILTGISFREDDNLGQKNVKMVVWIDGKKYLEVKSAAFIIKGLPAGSHQIKLEIYSLENQPVGLAKEFMVNIPK
ncbi:hypothetical protein [Bacillus sp. JJ1764]|uniref:hypothetical protein n=1 Tax=Bacillus sp. JJ1764 TaxID=3122964 RepID=UPI002FFFB4E9